MNPYGRIIVWQGIGAFALAFGVLLWTSYHAAQAVFERSRMHDTMEPAVESDQASTNARNPQYDVNTIVTAHLFGKVQESQKVVEQTPETNLQINLLGLIASSDKRFARAIINVTGAKPRSYSVGDDIQGTDASVHAVEARRVLLKRSNAVESLKLKRKDIDTLND